MANQKLVTCHISWWIHSFIRRWSRRRRHRCVRRLQVNAPERKNIHSVSLCSPNNNGTQSLYPRFDAAMHDAIEKNCRMAAQAHGGGKFIVNLWNRQFKSSQLFDFFLSLYSIHCSGSRSASARINVFQLWKEIDTSARARSQFNSWNACWANRAQIMRSRPNCVGPRKHATHRQHTTCPLLPSSRFPIYNNQCVCVCVFCFLSADHCLGGALANEQRLRPVAQLKYVGKQNRCPNSGRTSPCVVHIANGVKWIEKLFYFDWVNIDQFYYCVFFHRTKCVTSRSAGTRLLWRTHSELLLRLTTIWIFSVYFLCQSRFAAFERTYYLPI